VEPSAECDDWVGEGSRSGSWQLKVAVKRRLEGQPGSRDNETKLKSERKEKYYVVGNNTQSWNEGRTNSVAEASWRCDTELFSCDEWSMIWLDFLQLADRHRILNSREHKGLLEK
jgi:hypothetical protein